MQHRWDSYQWARAHLRYTTVRNPYAYADSLAVGDPHSNTNCNADGHCYGNAYCYGNSYSDSYRDRNANSYGYSQTDTYAEISANAKAASDSCAQALNPS